MVIGNENGELEAPDKSLEEKLDDADESAEDQVSDAEKEASQDSDTDAEEKEPEEVLKEEPKTYSQEYVEKLRRENAAARVENRRLKGQPEIDPATGNPMAPAPGKTPGPGQTGQFFDPRVDEMIVDNKMAQLKVDPDLKDLFKEVDEDGVTFEQRLLEKAYNEQWPVGELDALALKMGKSKLFGKIEQKAIDKTYNSLKKKKQDAGEKSGTSGKNTAPAEVGNLDDAINKSMEELGVTDLSKIAD